MLKTEKYPSRSFGTIIQRHRIKGWKPSSWVYNVLRNPPKQETHNARKEQLQKNANVNDIIFMMFSSCVTEYIHDLN